jgi:hypothetical protein
MAENPRHTPAWQRIRKQIVAAARARADPPAICGRPIDYTLSGRARWGPSVDHLYSIATHPGLAFDPSQLRIVHLTCNLRRGGKLGRARQLAARNGGARSGPNGGASGPTPADDGAHTPAEVAAWRRYREAGGTARTGWRW